MASIPLKFQSLEEWVNQQLDDAMVNNLLAENVN